MTGRLRWYLRRVAVMSGREIFHRLCSSARLVQFMIMDRLGITPTLGRGGAASQSWFRSREAPLFGGLPCALPPIGAKWDEILAGEHGALGYPWRWTTDRDTWFRAPDTGRMWPRSLFTHIDYRPGNPIGDIRVAWEPSRLQQLVDLGLIARAEMGSAVSARAVTLLKAQFLSWLASNPFARGIHYASAMECGLRILSICHAFDLVRDQIRSDDDLWTGLREMVECHAWLIERRLSLHSSAGNHTVAEAVGLLYAAVLFPEIRQSGRWRRIALRLLCSEAQRQILPDGGGIEQAFWYHLFVVDLFGLAAFLLASVGEMVPEPIAAALSRGRAFLNQIARGPDDLPRVGDADDGFALSAYLRLSWQDCGPQGTEPHVFRDTGYSLISLKGPAPARLLFDHGPLGMPPLYGHGHADALSVVLWQDREPLLLDPGTFGYNCAPEWRRYFRGTPAHNTICVGGRDQAAQSGAFAWMAPFRAELVSDGIEDGIQILLARHNGYRPLGVVHYRALIWRAAGGVLVWDRIAGQGEHRLVLSWHAAPGSRFAGGILYLGRTETSWRAVVRGGHLNAVSAQEKPPAGWAAPAYGVRSPILTVTASYEGLIPHEFTTWLLPPGHRDGDADIEILAAKVRQLVLSREASREPRGWQN